MCWTKRGAQLLLLVRCAGALLAGSALGEIRDSLWIGFPAISACRVAQSLLPSTFDGRGRCRYHHSLASNFTDLSLD
jgi:hypothetical protein